MKILLTGGGSGGHITPLLAVAHELKAHYPDVQVLYVGQHGDSLADVVARDRSIDATYSVWAGKFRRYHGERLRQVLDVKTFAKNVHDVFRLIRGVWQSWRLLGRLKPDVIFTRGGFVSVPVGLAAAARRIPYITNDLDAVPSLTNRIIGRWATVHTVALPKEIYPYPPDTVVTVGVPVNAQYQRVTPSQQAEYRKELGLEASDHVLFVTGGGLGAQRLNESVAEMVPNLFKKQPQLLVLHNVGRDHEAAMNTKYDSSLTSGQRQRVQVSGFVGDLYRRSGAADVVITRAGATIMAELAIQGKACIVVPNPQLTGGHQLKNAEVLVEQGAVLLIKEESLENSPNTLEVATEQLFNSAQKRHDLSERLAACAHPNAATELAELIMATAQPHTNGSE